MSKKITFILSVFMAFALQSMLAQGGATCATAYDVSTGTYNADHTGGIDQWFKYTALQDGKLTVSAAGESTEITYIQLYDACGGNNVDNAYTEMTFPVMEGTTYYIKWNGYYITTPYNFIVAESELLPGEMCENAISASLGDNSFSADQDVAVWYKYTATQTGKLFVAGCGNTTDVVDFDVKTDCQTNYYNFWPSMCASGIGIDATAGQTYYIKMINTTSSVGFTFAISEESWMAGEICASAITADYGINNHTLISETNEVKYYKYTAIQDGKLTISACATADVEVYDAFAQCQGNSIGKYGCNYKDIYIDATANQTYYFALMGGSSSETREFEISEQAWVEGEICSVAKNAVSGSNAFTGVLEEQVWYTYTATRDGKFSISAWNETTADIDIHVTSDCNNGNVATTSAHDGYEKIFTGVMGETYYFAITNYTNSEAFGFTVTETDWAAGEHCSTAIEALQAETFSGAQNEEVWYSYTAVNNSELTISACGNTIDDINIQVRSDCQGFMYPVEACAGKEKTFTATAGTTYYFIIKNSGSSTPFDFTITEVTLTGDDCSNPTVAQLGDNVFAGNDLGWYSFEATRNGKVSISACNVPDADLDLFVYDACGGSEVMVYYPCGYKAVDFNATAGVTYYFQMYSYSLSSYNFTVTESDWAQGEHCSSAKVAVNGSNTFSGAMNETIWYSYTALNDGELSISACSSLDEIYLDMMFDCQNTLSGVSYVCDWKEAQIVATAGTEYFFKLSNASSSTSFDFTINGLTTSLTDFEETKLKLFPNPAVSEINIDAIDKVNELTVINLAGSVVMNMNVVSNPILINLDKGVYMVEIKLKDGTTLMEKLMVK